MDCEDDSSSKKVWVLGFEPFGDVPVGLQGPGSVVGAAVQLVYLRGSSQSVKMKTRRPDNRALPGTCPTSGRRARSSRYMTLSR